MEIVTRDRIVADMQVAGKMEALHYLARVVGERCPALDQDSLYSALHEREQLGSTGIGDGIAIPHAKVADLDDIVVFFARSLQGVPFDALDNKRVHLFFLLLAPEGAAGPYLSSLARLSQFLKNPTVHTRLLQADGCEELYAVLAEY